MKMGVCLEMVFTEDPFENRIRKVADIGFECVEMWFVDDKGDPQELSRVARRCGVAVTNTVIGSPDGSLGGGLTNPGLREGWLKRTRRTLEFNNAAGIGATIVCTGNVVNGLRDQQIRQSVLQGLEATAELAEKAGVDLLLEPLNTTYDHAGYWLTSSDQGAELCRAVGSNRLGLLYDCYHMQIMEGDLLGHIERNLDVIKHFHSAGHPGRHELWIGEINYPHIVRRIEQVGYSGVFGLEYSPTLEPGESLRKTLQHLQS